MRGQTSLEYEAWRTLPTIIWVLKGRRNINTANRCSPELIYSLSSLCFYLVSSRLVSCMFLWPLGSSLVFLLFRCAFVRFKIGLSTAEHLRGSTAV